MPTLPSQPGCHCSNAFGRLDSEHHEWLLTFEERGARGVAELLDHFAVSSDMEHDEGTLHYVDFLKFVSFHNWQDPAAVTGIAQFIDDALHDYRQAAQIPASPEVRDHECEDLRQALRMVAAAADAAVRVTT